jgi:hypothetical protein
MQLAVYDLVGALFAPPEPGVSSYADRLFTRICGVIMDGFADPDFGPCEAAAEAGISLRCVTFRALYGSGFNLQSTHIFTSSGSRCAPPGPAGVAGNKRASERGRLRLWLSRLYSFRTKISPSLWLPARRPRRRAWQLQ